MAAEVAEDQLAQSQEEQVDERRRQASRITFYQEGDKTVVANRSFDPAGIWISSGASASVPAKGLNYWWAGIIPPCVKAVFPFEGFQPRDRDKSLDKWKFERWFVKGIEIVDANGRSWQRNLGQPLVELDGPGHISNPVLPVLASDQVTFVELEQCGT
ncbi:hypothetical protein [Streptomyces sp. WMMC940]|uniref:hypothetical protein n=1 Tax=Streptomyces sp. WMMC940 TaxID=3015153 RepID=UPI0022B619A2|nr:hypothetical protein [Streptomyces sp. WMMC940]MCZ7456746.1 hypothetical protein [Streptomyces sp. WMMC940]